MKKLVYLLAMPLLFTSAGLAKKHHWKVPCERVFVTGTQKREIAWALKGNGLKNNLYRNTCQEPVSDPSNADAILDIEYDEKIIEEHAAAVTLKRRTDAQNYYVTCRSDAAGYVCVDSEGYELDTSCKGANCTSSYGPSTYAVVDSLMQGLRNHIEKTMAWGYLFSVKDHKLLWKYESDTGAWSIDLGKYSACKHIWGTHFCKPPKALLP